MIKYVMLIKLQVQQLHVFNCSLSYCQMKRIEKRRDNPATSFSSFCGEMLRCLAVAVTGTISSCPYTWLYRRILMAQKTN